MDMDCFLIISEYMFNILFVHHGDRKCCYRYITLNVEKVPDFDNIQKATDRKLWRYFTVNLQCRDGIWSYLDRKQKMLICHSLVIGY
uniref:Uncharacterized protein n=1 Tax=Arion vulgaris TaxID=1028688 RepID=A0A0B7AEZ7_9EUPU